MQVNVHKRQTTTTTTKNKNQKPNNKTLDISAKFDIEREPTLPCILDNHDLTALIPRSRMKDTAGK